jgi:hypothetical protein
VEQRLASEAESDGQDQGEEEDEELEGAEEHRSERPHDDAIRVDALHAAKPISPYRGTRKSIGGVTRGGGHRRRRSKWGPLWATTA